MWIPESMLVVGGTSLMCWGSPTGLLKVVILGESILERGPV